MWWISLALAYETDQLTDRHLPLDDALPAADARMNKVLAAAIAATNARTQCRASEDRSRAVLRKEIVDRASGSHPVPHRGASRSLGYGRYSAWLETSEEVPRREFLSRDDLFGPVTVGESVLLALVGVCSTIRFGDVWLGTDKLDHFLDTGFHYTKRRTHAQAIRYGTRTELSYYGLWTSKAFSFADLAANEAGYRFYTGLGSEGSVVQRDADGCLTQVKPFTWADWVTEDFDEVKWPSTYTARVGAVVRAHVASEPERYCPTWEALGGPAYDASLATLPVPPYVGAKHPPREDPYRLGEVCASWTPTP